MDLKASLQTGTDSLQNGMPYIRLIARLKAKKPTASSSLKKVEKTERRDFTVAVTRFMAALNNGVS
jgi:hypothetical protein